LIATLVTVFLVLRILTTALKFYGQFECVSEHSHMVIMAPFELSVNLSKKIREGELLVGPSVGYVVFSKNF
jgi:hypothetical protein